MRFALGLEYDGRAYCGFQSQPSGCSVQDALARALAAIADAPVRAVAAGRTDAGVHATSQIVHFDAPVARPLTAWIRGVNSHLPSCTAILWCAPVADDFHARFAATARHYAYLLLDRDVRPALLHGRVGWFHAPLDVDAMRDASRVLVGRHDFSSFRAAECQAKSPVKTVARLDVTRSAGLVRIDVCADAFLQHMVRNIVGALVYVGNGRHPPAWIAELLAGRDRTRAAPTFAPDGLYLTGIDYPPRWNLPSTHAPIRAFGV
ncbi:MAG TPA: tRNA pseudouridine(38-40) synthase TruA [Casimicrobiaceae bacterium]|nr:tRNA pseudouridine(38-40) synthase TruA [Casimicrobiaceae bacterium]